MSKLQIKLVKSLIGRQPNHITIAHTLGLKKMNRVVTQPNNEAIKGMINKISYLLEVKECD